MEDLLSEDSQRICRISFQFFLWSEHGYFSCLARFFPKSLSEHFSKINKNTIEISISMKVEGGKILPSPLPEV